MSVEISIGVIFGSAFVILVRALVSFGGTFSTPKAIEFIDDMVYKICVILYFLRVYCRIVEPPVSW